jgi:hypothetical protein
MRRRLAVDEPIEPKAQATAVGRISGSSGRARGGTDLSDAPALGLAPDAAIAYSRKAILQIFHLYPRADRI